MPQYQLRACTVEDAHALARNNMSAFWTDENWVLIWKSHRTLEQVIDISSKRQARNLLRDRVILRHQAAVDTETGKIVGYARWKLPPGYVTVQGTNEPQWPDAQVPDVSEAEREEFSKLAESADWCPSSHMDALDEPVTKIKRELLAKKDYIGKL